MLYVFCGNNTNEIRRKALNKAEDLSEQGFAVTILEAETFEPGSLSAAASSASLFGGREVYVVDTPSINTEMEEELESVLPLLNDSQNAFVIIEGSLLAAARKRYEKFAESVMEYKSAAGERFNAFSLADALSRKDKKSLWMLFHEARQNGIATEELIGVMWWQLKTLRLAALCGSAAEAGLKEFPYTKAKRALAKFAPLEISTISRSLLALAHESRLGLYDADAALERWILRL